MIKKGYIEIKLCIINDLHYVCKWIMTMGLFPPSQMSLQHYKKGKLVLYDEKKFSEEIQKELAQSKYNVILKEEYNCVTSFLNYDSDKVAILTATLNYDLFKKNEAQTYELISEIMSEVGVVGRIVLLEDMFWQNTIDLDAYRIKNKNIKGIPIKAHPIFKGEMAVDVEKLPGYEEQIGNIWFGAAWKMWFNDFYYQYVPQKSVEKFSDCYSNQRISDTCRCITLYDDLWDYDKPENRQLQWKFKEAIHFKETVNLLKENRGKTNSDPHIEICDGQFEHGGVKQFKFYFDEDGNDTSKSRASKVLLEEYDKDRKLVHTQLETMSKEIFTET